MSSCFISVKAYFSFYGKCYRNSRNAKGLFKMQEIRYGKIPAKFHIAPYRRA